MKFLWAIALILSGCASPQWRTVMQHKNSANGHYKEGQCAVFAKDLQARASIKSNRVTWTETSVAPFVHSYRHQVFAYTSGLEIYFLDNFSAGPKWVGCVGDRWDACAMQYRSPSRVLITDIVVE